MTTIHITSAIINNNVHVTLSNCRIVTNSLNSHCMSTKRRNRPLSRTVTRIVIMQQQQQQQGTCSP